MTEITVKKIGDNWEVINGHMRFKTLLSIGNNFNVIDVESGEIKLVQIDKGEARIANNVIIL